MTLISFLAKQFIDVIEWNEPEDGILTYRYPMQDLEIQNGGQLTVSESQMAAFVNEGRIADVFGPGLYTLNTRNLPILTDLMNWDKDFESPFKSEVYFFSTRLQMDQKWGTATSITIRDKEFGAVRLHCYGIYSYRIVDPRVFFNQVSGTRDVYFTADLDGQLRDTILANIAPIFANEHIIFYGYTFTDKSVARDLASLTYLRVLLHFDETAYLCLITNFTAVKVNEFRELNVLSKADVRRNALVGVHTATVSPFSFSDSVAASSNLITRNPATPSLKGVWLLSIQAKK